MVKGVSFFVDFLTLVKLRHMDRNRKHFLCKSRDGQSHSVDVFAWLFPSTYLKLSMNRSALWMVVNGRGFGRRVDFARLILESVFSRGISIVAVHAGSDR
jgi:hypothetical protein